MGEIVPMVKVEVTAVGDVEGASEVSGSYSDRSVGGMQYTNLASTPLPDLKSSPRSPSEQSPTVTEYTGWIVAEPCLLRPLILGGGHQRNGCHL
jgi:hypothetical protein